MTDAELADRRTALSGTVVVDGTGQGRAVGIVRRLRATGLHARAGSVRDAADGLLVLLLPLMATGEPPHAASRSVGLLDDMAAVTCPADVPRRIVLSWFVEDADPLADELPRTVAADNGHSHPLQPDAWQAEMRTHGHPYVAARCRSSQLRLLLSGPVDVRLATEAHRAALRLDRGHLVTLCVPEIDDTGEVRWREEANVVAAAHARLPRRPTARAGRVRERSRRLFGR